MKKTFTLILLLLSQVSFAQNLINNWSFEDTVQCPDYLTQIDRSLGWSSYRETPDYYNACAPFVAFPNVCVSVPSNYYGYQYPKSGNAYAGLTTFGSTIMNQREYMGIQLNQPLAIGTKYFVSFYVCRTVSINFSAMNIATNKIGVRMSTVAYSNTNPHPIDNYAQVYTDSIITDTLNWIRISGSFIADSNYNYLIIGNFFNDSLTFHVSFDSLAGYAYYYFEDIKLSSDSNFVNGINENNSFSLIKIFPNPARDWIEIEGRGITKLSFHNILGKLCILTEDLSPSSIVINVSTFTRGIYFLKIATQKENIIKKIILQ